MKVDKDGGVVIDTNAMEWRELAPGVSIKVLRLKRETEEWTVMFRCEAGAVLPAHQHLGDAEIYNLEGAGYHEQTGPFKAGDYVFETDGSMHSPLVFTQQVMHIMFAKGPSQFFDEEGNPTFVMNVDRLVPFADEGVLALA